MNFQIVLPYLSMPWSLHDCIEGLDYRGECPLLVVDNSPNSDTKNLNQGNQLDLDIEYQYYPQNYGVPGSWNLGLDKGADYTIIISTSVRFSKPLRELLPMMAERARDTMAIFEGYHFFVINRALVKRIGYFDENFYPGYGEDQDWGHRLDLLGIKPESFYDMGNTSIGSGLQKRSGYWGFDSINTGRMDDYYAHKWGGHPGYFETPFNNPNNDLKYWPKVHH